jgi:hypothetical protein
MVIEVSNMQASAFIRRYLRGFSTMANGRQETSAI